ncbi:MAG: hypothetical protein ACLFVH_02510 [Phycisphaerae bacterium]
MRLTELLHRWWSGKASRATGKSPFCHDMAEAIRATCYSGLTCCNDLYRQSLPVYVEMVNLARHAGCRRILELGAGLSTGLWARYADQTGAEVTSVCADFAPTRSYLSQAPEGDLLDRRVRCVEGFTVSADQMKQFYAADPRDSLAGVPVRELVATLHHFSRPVSAGRANRRTERLEQQFGGSATASDILISGNKLEFPPDLLDLYCEEPRFSDMLDVLRQAETEGRAGLLEGLDGGWDLIFFDSGELSTIVEWQQLQHRVPVGGFVALHDIYFPKSLKSCLACAAIVADPSWDVVFVDNTTPQGLLIARRNSQKESSPC